MSFEFELDAEARDGLGKGASRRLRREGKVPAILYGAGQDPASLSLKHQELIKRLENNAFYSHILSIKFGSRVERAILEDIQRHPFKPTIVHVDLQRVIADEKIRVHVPLHFVNEETSIGVKQQGGVVSHLMIDVDAVCLPGDLPEYIEVDVAKLEIGDAIHLSGLNLPPGVEIPQLTQGEEFDVPVVSVQSRKGGDEELEEKGEDEHTDEE